MKVFAIASALVFGMAIPLATRADVSISIGEPGFYGRIDIGGLPHPELIFPQPVIIRPVVGVVREPVYLHVPPGHARDWAKHCARYNACGERVFFVHDHWYNDVYVPQYRKQHSDHGGKNQGSRGGEKGHGKGKH